MSQENREQQTYTGAALQTREARLGLGYAALCYVLWGLFPLYWKLLDHVGSFEILLHRMAWAFIFFLLAAFIMKLNPVRLFKDKRRIKYLLPATILVSANWGIFIYAVNNNQIVETSLGYYINPLVSILLGVLFVNEKLTRMQKVASILAAIGVLYLTVTLKTLPWVSLALALTFGFYGLIKKKAGYPAVEALIVETGLMFIPAVIGIVIIGLMGTSHFLAAPYDVPSWRDTILLIIAGPVTAIPLLLFAKAANMAPLSLIGFTQYLSPTMTLIIGTLIFNEPFTSAHVICFTFIWTGIALIVAEAVIRDRASRKKIRSS